MSVRIEIQTGHAAGESYVFDPGPVLIGRGPECHVKLHPMKDTQVSRAVHARLVREGDRWRLECLHDSGVNVVVGGGGAPRLLKSGERLELEGTTEFELSVGGPRLSAVPSSLPLPATERNDHHGASLPVARVVPEELTRHGRQSRRWVAVLAVVVVALGGIGWLVISSLSGRTSLNEQQIAGAESRLSQLATASEAHINSLKASLEQLSQQSPAALAEALRAAGASVWVVGGLDAEGVFEPVGTAWTVLPNRLATNAHVAEGLKALAAKKEKKIRQLVARKDSSGKPQLVLSDRVQVHPGYAEWNARFGSQFQSAAGNKIAQIGFIPACDVALLEVQSGDPGSPLRLAYEGLAALAPATPVGYVGFPMEGVPGFPSQQTVTGAVTNQTDYFFRPDTAEDGQLIHHNAFVVGGGSGSPLINAQGEVIGLVSAGSVIGQAELGRIPIGLNFAQRIDVLRELIDSAADKNQLARSGRWGDVATALLERYDAVIGPLTGRDLRNTLLADLQSRLKRAPTEEEVKAITRVKLLDKSTFTIKKGKLEGAVSMKVQLRSGLAYSFGSAGAGYPPLRMAVVIDKNAKDALTSGSWVWCPCISILSSSKPREAEIMIWTDRDPPAPLEAVLVMYGYQP